MLSVVDLIDAGTLSREMAAYSLAAIGAGASFMVGAMPGGAGKTTVMGALLNLVPPDARLYPADSLQTIEQGLGGRQPRSCYVCHEIGNGPYYAYLWGESLRRYFELPAAGHMIATNLHADTYEQARDQVCVDNEVPSAHFRGVNLLYFLAVDGRGWGGRRRIVSIWESDGRGVHRKVFGAGVAGPPGDLSGIVGAEQLAVACQAVDALTASGARAIEEVRASIVEGKTWK
jgi:hypothetical protein